MTPAIEFLESPEYQMWAEEKRWGQSGVHRSEVLRACVNVGALSTHRRPMFEIINDHPRYCPLFDCSKAKSAKAVRKAERARRQAKARGEEQCTTTTKDTAGPAAGLSHLIRMAFWESTPRTLLSTEHGTS
jgi:hypothetical protein